jgi:hypothetical protein
MTLFWIIVLMIIYLLACLSLGGRVTTTITGRHDSDPGLTSLATHFLLGHGLLAGLWLIIALLGLFTPLVIAAVLGVGIVVGFRSAGDTLARARTHLAQIAARLATLSIGWKLANVLLVITMALSLLRAFNLPSWDAMNFYLALPKLVSATQHIKPLPGFEGFTAMFGLQAEMHHAALLSLSNGNDILARLFTWPVSLSLALVLLSIGRLVGLGRLGQWIMLSAVYTSTTVLNLTGDGKTDVFAAAMGVAAFYYVLKSEGGSNHKMLWLSGLFAGLSVMAKVTYVGTLIPCVVVLLSLQYLTLNRPWNVQSVVTLLRRLFQFAVCAAIPMIPMLLKNLVLFEQIVPVAHSQFLSGEAWFSEEAKRRALLTYPFAVTLSLDPNLYGNLSPLPLAFAPLILILPRPRNFLTSRFVQLNLAALVGIILWFIFGRNAVLIIRYMLAPLFILFLLPMKAAEYVSTSGAKPNILNAAILICIVGLFVIGIPNFRSDIPAFTRFLAGHTLDCDDDPDARSCVLLAINKDASPGNRVFALSYPRYWLRPDLLQCLSTLSEIHGAHTLPPGNARWLYLYQRGFRYLLLDKTGFINVDMPRDSGNPFDMQNLPPGLKLTKIFDAANAAAYRLDWEIQQEPSGMSCKPLNDKVWQIDND